MDWLELVLVFVDSSTIVLVSFALYGLLVSTRLEMSKGLLGI